MAETIASKISAASIPQQSTLGYTDRVDVFLRRTPREYLQDQLPSTAQIPSFVSQFNTKHNLPMQRLLSFGAVDRSKIIPQNYQSEMLQSCEWCDKLAAAGDQDAQEVAQILRRDCELNQEILDRHYAVILC